MGIIKSRALQRLFNFIPGKSAKSGDVNEELNQLIQFNNDAVEDLENHEARITTTEEGGAFTSQKLDTHMGEAGHNNWYYTEQEIDTLLTELKGSGYTGESLKQLKSTITGLQQQIDNLDDIYSTDAERIAAVNDIINQFTIANEDLSAMLANKANKDNVYTKAETDEKVWGTANLADMSVTRQKMANLSVGTPQLEDNAITLAKLGTDIKANIGQTMDAIQVARITENERQTLKEEYVTIESDQAIIPVPANVVEGQVSDVRLYGRSLRQELNYNRDTWAEWAKSAGVTGDSSGLNFSTDTGEKLATYGFAHVKNSTKYGFLVNVLVNTLTLSLFRNSALTGSAQAVIGAGVVGNIKQVITTQANITNKTFSIFTQISELPGKQIKISDVRLFELPIGSEIESDFNTLTADQLAQKYPYIKGGGTKQTDSVTVKSVGKNLLNKETLVLGTLGTTTGLESSATTTLRSIFIKIEGNTDFNVKRFENIAGITYYWYDANKNFISYTGWGSAINWSQKSPINAQYVRILLGNISDKNLVQTILEKGNVGSATYEPYTENSITTPPIGGSLPNGVKDEFNAITGVHRKNVSDDYVLQDTDIIGIGQLINVDVVQIRSRNNGFAPNAKTWTNGIDNVIRINNYQGKEIGVIDNINNIGDWYTENTDGGRLRFIVAKGTTVAQAKAQLAGLSLNYQLATPIVTSHAEQDLAVYPSGTIFIEPVGLADQTTIPTTRIVAPTTLKTAYLSVKRRITGILTAIQNAATELEQDYARKLASLDEEFLSGQKSELVTIQADSIPVPPTLKDDVPLEVALHGNYVDNILGDEGDFENYSAGTTTFICDGDTVTLDNTRQYYGGKSLRLTSSGNIKFPLLAIDKAQAVQGRYYFARIMVNISRIAPANVGLLRFFTFNPGGYTNSSDGDTTPDVSLLNTWQPVYFKFQGKSPSGTRVTFSTHNGGTNMDLNVDAFFITEISQSEFNTLNYAQLNAKYPQKANSTALRVRGTAEVQGETREKSVYVNLDRPLMQMGELKDSFDFSTGKLTRYIGEVTLTSAMLLGLDTGSYSNLDIVVCDTAPFINRKPWTQGVDNSLKVSGIQTEVANSAPGYTAHTGWGFSTSSSQLSILLPKGFAASLPTAALHLIGTKIHYILAEPQITYVSPQTAKMFKDGQVLIEPVIRNRVTYSSVSGLVVSNPRCLIRNVRELYKIVGGRKHSVPINNLTILGGGSALTIPGAVNGEIYEVVYDYGTRVVPPIISYRLNPTLKSVVNSNTARLELIEKALNEMLLG